MIKKIFIAAALFCFSSVAFAEENSCMSAQDALVKLQEGNQRFVKMKLKHPDESFARRKELTQGQHPFVAILSCSDSRVPTEQIFDQGLGDVFVVRNAGNVMDEHVLGSIEYAVEHLGVNLVVVLGHESCGAIAATLGSKTDTKGIESIKEEIAPSVGLCKKQNKLTPENVTKIHASLEAQEILKDDDLQECIKEHSVKVIPAYYHLDTGVVEFLE